MESLGAFFCLVCTCFFQKAKDPSTGLHLFWQNDHVIFILTKFSFYLNGFFNDILNSKRKSMQYFVTKLKYICCFDTDEFPIPNGTESNNTYEDIYILV